MKYASIIVETRDMDELPALIDAHISKLPDTFDHYFYGSSFNQHLLEQISDDVKFINTGDKQFDQLRFNMLLTSPDFWTQYTDYERVLFYQTDSMIFREGVEEFLQWDYVGSAWKFQEHGGNGGFSLRNPRVMKRLCTEYTYTFDRNEDVFFCNLMHDLDENLAPREVCEKWGVEAVFSLGTFGGHAWWKYLTEEQCQIVKHQYNEIREV
jgi:hypothetical protein